MKTDFSCGMSRRDCNFGFAAGILSGILAIPVFLTAVPALKQSGWFLLLLPAFAVALPAGLALTYKLGRNISIAWQFSKFAVTGGLSALVDLGVLAGQVFLFQSLLRLTPEQILFEYGISLSLYSTYKAVSFVVANINSFYWNKYWTFSDRVADTAIPNYLIFFIVSIIGFALNVASATYVFHTIRPFPGLHSGQWSLVGGIAGSVAGMAWNFLGYRLFVFRPSLSGSAS